MFYLYFCNSIRVYHIISDMTYRPLSKSLLAEPSVNTIQPHFSFTRLANSPSSVLIIRLHWGSKPQSLSFHKKVKVEEELRRMLSEGKIVPTRDPQVAGDIRVCLSVLHQQTDRPRQLSLSHVLTNFCHKINF